MTIKRILLTGDDGYNSIGTRLLIHWLKQKYDLAICGTKVQQSGVGGKLNIKHGGKFYSAKVDGVPAVYVSGTPGDAMELAVVYFQEKFDLVISGINLGPNVVGELASGTMTAAVRAVKLQLAPRAIAFSWNAPAKLWYQSHDGVEAINEFIAYPGESAFNLVMKAVKENFWDCPLLNINFPTGPSQKVKFTKFLPYFADYYTPVELNQKNKTYFYPLKSRGQTPEQLDFDAFAMNAGYISITPCQLDLLAENIYSKLQRLSFSL